MPWPTGRRPAGADDALLAGVQQVTDTRLGRDLWTGIEARHRRRRRGRRSRVSHVHAAAAGPGRHPADRGARAACRGWRCSRRSTAAAPRKRRFRRWRNRRTIRRPTSQRANFADAQYDAAVADLERILREESRSAGSATVMVIERNLQAIDDAINEARAALDADPANTLSEFTPGRRAPAQAGPAARAAELSTGGD